MADRLPNRFQKNPANLEDLFQSSESEESTRPVQRRNTQMEELKRQDRAARLGLSEPDLSEASKASPHRLGKPGDS